MSLVGSLVNRLLGWRRRSTSLIRGLGCQQNADDSHRNQTIQERADRRTRVPVSAVFLNQQDAIDYATGHRNMNPASKFD